MGEMGTSGYSGYSGRSGYSGISGYSGNSTSGYSGISGYSGQDGLIGPDGLSGYSGYSGQDGLIGPDGISGYSGYSGLDGILGDRLSNNTTEVILFENGIIQLPKESILYNNTSTIAVTTADQILDSFDATLYRTAKYLIQGINGGDVHSTEIILTHDDTNVYIAEYGIIGTSTTLYTVSGSITSGIVNLTVSTSEANTIFDFVKTSIVSRVLSGLSGDLMLLSGSEDLMSGSGSIDLNA